MMYDAVIMRTIVDLPSDQVEALGKCSKLLGISRAEAVRRAVARFLEEEEADREKAFGAWEKNARNSSDFIRCIRQEWES